MTRKPRTRNVGLKRILKLWDALRDGRQWTLHELAARFDVTTRTVRRDLAALEEVGAAICHDAGDKYQAGTWWILERMR